MNNVIIMVLTIDNNNKKINDRIYWIWRNTNNLNNGRNKINNALNGNNSQ